MPLSLAARLWLLSLAGLRWRPAQTSQESQQPTGCAAGERPAPPGAGWMAAAAATPRAPQAAASPQPPTAAVIEILSAGHRPLPQAALLGRLSPTDLRDRRARRPRRHPASLRACLPACML